MCDSGLQSTSTTIFTMFTVVPILYLPANRCPDDTTLYHNHDNRPTYQSSSTVSIKNLQFRCCRRLQRWLQTLSFVNEPIQSLIYWHLQLVCSSLISSSLTVVGFQFAGLEFGYECWCSGTMAKKRSQMNDAKCNHTCPGDTSSRCGGYLAVNIYHTGYEG